MNQLNRLPEGWQWTAIEDIARVRTGATPLKKRKEYYEGGTVPWVTSSLLNETFITKTDEKITELAVKETNAKVFPKNTLLVAMYGEGQTRGRVSELLIEAATNQACAAIILEEAFELKPYVKYFFLRNYAEIRRLSSGGVQPNLNLGIIKSTQLPLPPLNEQRRIVEKIEALTARSRKAREELEAIPALLDQFRQSVLAAAFRGDLTADWREQNPNVEPVEKLLERIRVERRKRWEEAELAKIKAKGKVVRDDKWRGKYQEPEIVDPSDLPQLPNGWCWVKWGQLGNSQNGRAFPSAEYSKTGTKLLRPGNLHFSGSVEWTDSNTRYMPNEWADKYPDYIIKGGELVINLTAQSLADEFLGRVCLTSEDERCLLNQRIARLTPLKISSKFCLWLFKSPIFRKFVDRLNTGSLIQHMFISQVDEFVFPLPPFDEQTEIVKRIEVQLSRMHEIRETVEISLENLLSLNQAILAKAFRGELVSQDPNDEPASVLLERIRAEREKLGGKKRARSKA